MLFNKAWWNNLPQGHREVITKAFHEVGPEVAKMKEAAMNSAIDTMKAAKLNVRVASESERNKFASATSQRARAAYIERAGADGKKILDILDAERKKLGL